MSLPRLAAVELQLVMHCLDKRSLLALARCSRFTLAAASDEFAWRCLSPLHLDFTPATLDLSSCLSSCLLRFCSVALRWTAPERAAPLLGQVAVSEEELDALAAVQRVSALDCTRRHVSQEVGWAEKLLPRLPRASLTSLRLGDQDRLPPAALARAVFRQPLLRTLEFWSDPPLHEHGSAGEEEDEAEEADEEDGAQEEKEEEKQQGQEEEAQEKDGADEKPEDEIDLAELLASAPPRSLTHLTMHFPSASLHSAAPLLLAACTSLRRLELKCVSTNCASLLLRKPSLANLAELALECWSSGAREDRIFSSLGNLSSLSLGFLHSSSKLLSPLLLAASESCPLLRRLSLDSINRSRWLANVTAADSAALRMLRRLEELTLSDWIDLDDGPVDWPLLFSSLPLLRRLGVRTCQQPDALVSAAAQHCARLESISLRACQLDVEADDDVAEAPCLVVVQRALESCPRLTRFAMQLPPMHKYVFSSFDPMAPPFRTAHWHRVHSAWQVLAQQQPGRVLLEL